MKPAYKNFFFFCIFVSGIGLNTSAHAADAAAGKAKSASCSACHGANGISPSPDWPNLAGQKENYLKSQIIAFRDGARSNALMSPMVKGLSDQDAANLAAFYANIK